jgi:hypothetical protein
MRRREFITLLGGAAAAWPLAARAQQADGMRRIGFLGGGTVSLRPIYNGLLQGMRELGYWEGKDFVVEWRLAEGQYERFTEFAAEMVRLKVEVSVRRAIQKRSKRAVIAFSYRLFVAAHPRGRASPYRKQPRSLPTVGFLVPNTRSASRGATLRYLPQYSPDLNPMMPFRKLKACLRTAAERTIPRLRRRIGTFARNLTAREASNCFRHAGYA